MQEPAVDRGVPGYHNGSRNPIPSPSPNPNPNSNPNPNRTSAVICGVQADRSTVLIDGVPVEGVEEFILFGREPTGSATHDWSCLLSDEFSIEVMEMQFSGYQHTPHQALVMTVLLYDAETWTLLDADIKKLQTFHMRCQQQILDIR